MAPVIPTHRPIVTPERAAIAIAAMAVASSLFLAFGAARADAPPRASDSLACIDRTAEAGQSGQAEAVDLGPLRLQ